MARQCEASREAVIEFMEERGDSGCPVCGGPPSAHESEIEWEDLNEGIEVPIGPLNPQQEEALARDR